MNVFCSTLYLCILERKKLTLTLLSKHFNQISQTFLTMVKQSALNSLLNPGKEKGVDGTSVL